MGIIVNRISSTFTFVEIPVFNFIEDYYLQRNHLLKEYFN